MFSPFTAWFPGGATLSQPCIRWLQPLTEPDLRISRIRLFRQIHRLSSDSRFGFGDNVSQALCPALFPLLDTPACQPLPSTGITRLQRYYELIRLPVPHPQTLVSSVMSTPLSEEGTGSPRFLTNPLDNMPWTMTPVEYPPSRL